MGFGPTSPTPVYEDTTACIEWTNNVIGGRERAKHIDIRKLFAHEAAQIGHLRLKRVSTDDQLADVFTKSLHRGPTAGTIRYNLCSYLRRNVTEVAVIVRDVGPHEGKRDSQRKQSESTSTLTRGVSQLWEFKVRV